MPLPKPKEKENKEDFISRFMKNKNAIKEFDNEKQRLAIAYNIWKKKKIFSEEFNKLKYYLGKIN